MNIDDVLLTPKETEILANKHLEKHGCLDTFKRERDKAQCLKLLEWLKKPCKEHDWHLTEPTPKRKFCRTCMSELEAMLREGK